MRLGFLTNNMGTGGAQKIMAFVINSLASYADKIYIIMTQHEMDYTFPLNVKKIYISEYTKDSQNSLQKICFMNKLSKETKNIVINESIDILCSFGYYYTTIAVQAVKGTKCKVIGSERRSPQMLPRLLQLMSVYAYSHCDKVVFQLQGARDFYSKIPDNKIEIIPNPYFSPFKSCPNNSYKRKIVSMAAARLEFEKGFDIGIRAMSEVVRKHSDYKLEIYGEGDFEKMYGELIDKLNMRKFVKYKGFSNNIIQAIGDSNVFILPSRSEGIPNMLLEAMAAGIPCVATDCPPGGPRMLTEDNKYGLLVPTEDYKSMSQAICDIIEDIELRNRLSQNAKEVISRFSPQKIEKMWWNCFSSLIGVMS